MILTVMLARLMPSGCICSGSTLLSEPEVWRGLFLQNTGVTLSFQFPRTRAHKSAEASLYQDWMPFLIDRGSFLDIWVMMSQVGWDGIIMWVWCRHWSKDCSLVRLYPFSSLVMGNLLQIHHRLRFCRLSSTADNQTDRRVARSLQKGIDFK